MSCLLRGLKWPKTGLRENRVIVQFSDVYKHRPKTGWWPRTGGFTLPVLIICFLIDYFMHNCALFFIQFHCYHIMNRCMRTRWVFQRLITHSNSISELFYCFLFILRHTYYVHCSCT